MVVMEKYGSRKFIVAILSLMMSFALALMGKMSAEWAGIVSTVNIAYHGANMLIARKAANDG